MVTTNLKNYIFFILILFIVSCKPSQKDESLIVPAISFRVNADSIHCKINDTLKLILTFENSSQYNQTINFTGYLILHWTRKEGVFDNSPSIFISDSINDQRDPNYPIKWSDDQSVVLEPGEKVSKEVKILLHPDFFTTRSQNLVFRYLTRNNGSKPRWYLMSNEFNVKPES